MSLADIPGGDAYQATMSYFLFMRRSLSRFNEMSGRCDESRYNRAAPILVGNNPTGVAAIKKAFRCPTPQLHSV